MAIKLKSPWSTGNIRLSIWRIAQLSSGPTGGTNREADDLTEQRERQGYTGNEAQVDTVRKVERQTYRNSNSEVAFTRKTH